MLENKKYFLNEIIREQKYFLNEIIRFIIKSLNFYQLGEIKIGLRMILDYPNIVFQFRLLKNLK